MAPRPTAPSPQDRRRFLSRLGILSAVLGLTAFTKTADAALIAPAPTSTDPLTRGFRAIFSTLEPEDQELAISLAYSLSKASKSTKVSGEYGPPNPRELYTDEQYAFMLSHYEEGKADAARRKAKNGE